MPRHVKQAENPTPEKRIFPPPEIEPEEIAVVVRSSRDIIETDEMPMDSCWHFLAMNLLPALINWHLRDRQDYYVGGNMFIYYKLGGVRLRFLGPDFLFVKGVQREPMRRYWMVYKEKDVVPNVALELLSPRTRKTDLGAKKDRYERELRIPEYFVYDPEQEWFQGWRLAGNIYVPIEPDDDRGMLWSEELSLWLGTWTGELQGYTAVWPRFYDTQGKMLPTAEEYERQRADAERRRADTLQHELDALKAAKKRNGNT